MTVLSVRPHGVSQRFVCLLYHDVHPAAGFDYGRLGPWAVMYHVSDQVLRQHLALITSANAQPLDLESLRGSLSGSSTRDAADRRGVVLCFDDGWQGAVLRAAPILSERAMPALFFVTTQFIGQKYFATPAELRGLDCRLFTVGSHGVSHRMLNALSSTAISEELSASKRCLEDMLGRSVTALSIPGGALDARVVTIARELGYTEIFTSDIGVNPTRLGRWGIARIGVTRATSLATMAGWLSFRLERERWRKAVLSVPKMVLGMRTYSRLRRMLLGEGDGYEPLFQP